MSSLVRVPLEAIEAAAARTLPQFPEVAGAYLFGSALADCRPDSDIDLGLVLDPTVAEPPGWGFAGLESRIESALGRLDGHPFEVTVVRPDRVLFAFRVIREGRMIYEANPDAVAEFVERVARRYPELAYRYRQAVQEVLGR